MLSYQIKFLTAFSLIWLCVLDIKSNGILRRNCVCTIHWFPYYMRKFGFDWSSATVKLNKKKNSHWNPLKVDQLMLLNVWNECNQYDIIALPAITTDTGILCRSLCALLLSFNFANRACLDTNSAKQLNPII